jgi:hypothetical protein
VLVKAEEKKFDEIIWLDKPSKYLLITHFGNGDEFD